DVLRPLLRRRVRPLRDHGHVFVRRWRGGHGRAGQLLGHPVPPREVVVGRPRPAAVVRRTGRRPRAGLGGGDVGVIDLYPAIDLRGGRCVRLYQGDYDRETHYGDDPVSQARAFADAGAPWIHVVDLDAARSGEATNREVIAAICAAVDVPVQSGGGVRTVDAAAALADAG